MIGRHVKRFDNVKHLQCDSHTESLRENMAITKITCADDLAVLAKEAVEQVGRNKRFGDLIGAILMANHVAEWYFQVDLSRKFGLSEMEAMKVAYPEWDTIRQLANGIKHCKLAHPVRAQLDDVHWEHSDFWDSPGHIDENGSDWFVQHSDQERSVAVLIKVFLEKFENTSSRPSVK